MAQNSFPQFVRSGCASSGVRNASSCLAASAVATVTRPPLLVTLSTVRNARVTSRITAATSVSATSTSIIVQPSSHPRRPRPPAALAGYAQPREKRARQQQDHRRQQRQRHEHFNDGEAGVPPPEESHPRQAPLPFHFYPASGSSRRCWKGLFARRGRSGCRAGRAGEEAEGVPEKSPETGD